MMAARAFVRSRSHRHGDEYHGQHVRSSMVSRSAGPSVPAIIALLGLHLPGCGCAPAAMKRQSAGGLVLSASLAPTLADPLPPVLEY